MMVGRPSEERAYVRDVQDALRTRPDVLYIPGLSAEEVAAAMEEADLLVLASHMQASPLCILEAMSHRLAWLATPGCGAVSEHAGGIMTAVPFRRTFAASCRSRNYVVRLPMWAISIGKPVTNGAMCSRDGSR